MAQLTRVQLTQDIVTNVYTNTKKLIKGNTVRDRFRNVVDSTLIKDEDADNIGGYMKIGAGGFVNIAFIKAASPSNNFLRDDGTWQPIGGGTFVPLTGTDVGAPITGDLEIALNKGIIGKDNAVTNYFNRISANLNSANGRAISLATSDNGENNYSAYIRMYAQGAYAGRMIINNNYPNFLGLEYAGDYSAYFTSARSIPDRNYNDNRYMQMSVYLTSGKIASAYLPSYVDDVLEYANLTDLTTNGTQETGKIYVTLDTNKIYRWSGSVYVEITASPGTTDSVTEGVTNLYFTTARARASVSANTPLSYNASTGVFSIAAANGTTNGYLSSTDWTTFNSKLSANQTISFAPSGDVSSTGGSSGTNLTPAITVTGIQGKGITLATGLLKYNGTAWAFDNSTYLTSAVTSVSAGTGMSFTSITGTGSVAIDTAKVPYLSGGFSSGLLKWNGSAWTFDTTAYLGGGGTDTVLFTTAAGALSTSSLFTYNVNNGFSLSMNAGTGSVGSLFTLTGAAHTALTASAERNAVNFNMSATKQWNTGALTTQREVLFQAPTYSFVGASTITNAATVAITGAPVAGTNATITNAYSLWVQGGNSSFGSTAPQITGLVNIVNDTNAFASLLSLNNSNGSTAAANAMRFAESSTLNTILVKYGSGNTSTINGISMTGNFGIFNNDANTGGKGLVLMANPIHIWAGGSGGTGNMGFRVDTAAIKFGLISALTSAGHSTIHNVGSMAYNYVAKTGAYTLTSADYLVDCTSGTFTCTLPTAASIAGRVYIVFNSGAGTITVGTTSSQTINGAASVSLTQYQFARVMSNGANWIKY